MCTLYERIQALCKNKGVTGSRMCLDLGLSKSTLSDIKSGRKKGISMSTAQKIAGYFGITVDELYGEESKKEKPTVKDDELSKNRKKLIDFAGEIGTAIFKGDQPYTEGTPEYNAVSKALKRFNFILKKVEPKLSKNGVKVDLTAMILNTIGNNKRYSDNDTTINLKG